MITDVVKKGNIVTFLLNDSTNIKNIPVLSTTKIPYKATKTVVFKFDNILNIPHSKIGIFATKKDLINRKYPLLEIKNNNSYHQIFYGDSLESIPKELIFTKV
jgi:hypothetical protein